MYSLVGIVKFEVFKTFFNSMKTCLQVSLRGNLTLFNLMDFPCNKYGLVHFVF